MKPDPSTTSSTTPPTRPDDTPYSFWERHYATLTRPTDGRASAVLTRFVEGRRPGTALELGCARGDDALWLARQGWFVTAVDISESALAAAGSAAHAARVADRVRFERHDLTETFPDGAFDLVTALFLQSPLPFARDRVLRRAAEAVASGGLLLVAAHGSATPGSWSGDDPRFPTAEDELAAIAPDPDLWRTIFAGSIARPTKGRDGETAERIDTVIALERR